MTTKRKTVVMLVAVTVPREMSSRGARREVRTLINDQCNYSWDEGDVKVRRIRPLTSFGE